MKRTLSGILLGCAVWLSGCGIGPGGVPASYKGLVATRGFVLQDIYLTDSSPTWFMNRSFHIARENIAAGSLQVVWGNYAVYYGGETQLGSGTYKAAVEYPAGTITPCSFGGSPSITVSGYEDATTDPCGPAIPNGATFWVRMLYINPTGVNIFPATAIFDLSREQFESGVGTPHDAVAGGNIVTTPNSFWMSPTALIAPTTKPSVCIIGDSRAVGYKDEVNDKSGDVGEIARSIGPSYAYSNLGAVGEAAQGAVSHLVNRSRLFQFCTHVIDEYGINDLTPPRTAAQIAADRSTLATLSGRPTFGTTLPAETSSTDSWSTLANQTAIRNPDQFNQLVRSGISGEVGYFDVAAGLDPKHLEKFPVGPVPGTAAGPPMYSTPDGIHENATGNMLIQHSGVINPAAISKVR